MRSMRLILPQHDQQVQLARALESSIMQCLANADADRANADKWFAQAHKMEQKWTTDFGRHYSYWLYEVTKCD